MSRVEEMEKRCELKHKHWQDFSWAWQPTRIGKRRRLRCVYIIYVLWGNLECVEHIVQTSREHVLHCRAISDEIAEEKMSQTQPRSFSEWAHRTWGAFEGNLVSVVAFSRVIQLCIWGIKCLRVERNMWEIFCSVFIALFPVSSTLSSHHRHLVSLSAAVYLFIFLPTTPPTLFLLGCRARSLKQIKIVESFAVRFSSSENIFMRIQCALFFI